MSSPNPSVAHFRRVLVAVAVENREEVLQLMDEIGREAIREMKKRCPVEADRPFRRKPGTLRNSIRYKVFKNDESSGPRLGSFRPPTLVFYAGDNVAFYAIFVEYGTRAGVKGQRISVLTKNGKNRTRKVYRTHPGNAAQPFFLPVIRGLQQKLEARIIERLAPGLSTWPEAA